MMNNNNNTFQVSIIDHVNQSLMHNHHIITTAIGMQTLLNALFIKRELCQRAMYKGTDNGGQTDQLTNRLEAEVDQTKEKLNNSLSQKPPVFLIPKLKVLQPFSTAKPTITSSDTQIQSADDNLCK